MKHNGLDHLAIAVPDTEAALKLWRDQFGFKVLYSEDVSGGTVATHAGSSATSVARKKWGGLASLLSQGGRHRCGDEGFARAHCTRAASRHAG